MSEKSEEKRQAKEKVMKMMKENKLYDDLRTSVRVAIDKTLDRRQQGVSSKPDDSKIKQYYSLQNNEIASGFVIDFLRSLGLLNALTSLESSLTEATYYDRSMLREIFQIEERPGQPLMLQLFRSVEQEDGRFESTANLPTKQTEPTFQMHSTRNLHSSFDDAFDDDNSNDIFKHVKSLVS